MSVYKLLALIILSSFQSFIYAWKPSHTQNNDEHSSSSFNETSDATLQSLVDSTLQSLVDERFHVKIRRQLHKIPELMYKEVKTREVLMEVLDGLNVTNYTTGWGKNVHTDSFSGEGGYGIVADIGTGDPPCVLLRADMDALPVHEQTSGGDMDEFRSQHPGRMHACGHDGHMTMLLGAVAVLKQMEEVGELKGTVRIMFQPAEEGGAGGKRMVEEGVLDMYPPVQHAFAMHLWPTLPSGMIGGKAGPLLAGADSFEMTITGVGGHAAMPHLAVDPIVTSSAIIQSLQSIVSRNLSPLESGVCSVTAINAGEAFNVIPNQVTLRGTIRALSIATLNALRMKVTDISKSIAHAHGCTTNITFWKDAYPPTINNAELWSFIQQVAAPLSINNEIVHLDATMGAEDFSFIAEQVPSVFVLLGQGNGDIVPISEYGLHHPEFAIDEQVLPIGSRIHVQFALSTIDKLIQENDVEVNKC